MRIRHRGHRHLLLLEDRDVALLIDILEAALPAEEISGARSSNPALSGFFNSVYGQLIDTAREVWSRGAANPANPAPASTQTA